MKHILFRISIRNSNWVSSCLQHRTEMEISLANQPHSLLMAKSSLLKATKINANVKSNKYSFFIFQGFGVRCTLPRLDELLQRHSLWVIKKNLYFAIFYFTFLPSSSFFFVTFLLYPFLLVNDLTRCFFFAFVVLCNLLLDVSCNKNYIGELEQRRRMLRGITCSPKSNWSLNKLRLIEHFQRQKLSKKNCSTSASFCQK